MTEKGDRETVAVMEAERALSRAKSRYERTFRALAKEQTVLRRRKEQAAADWENERSELESSLRKAKELYIALTDEHS